MDEQRQRMTEDLGSVLQGELLVDPLSTMLYASDASLYQVEPLAVACPKTLDDVISIVRYANETGVGVFPRGAGSGVAGGCLGRGIVVDFSRHLHRVLSVDSQTVTVEAGVVRDQLNRQLRPLGRYFPPDPSNGPITTIGGMLAVDAAGSRSVRIGSTRDHVAKLEMVLADGTIIEAGSEPLIGRTADPGDPHQRLCDGLARILRENNELIQERQPLLPRNCSGYHLRGILSKDRLELARMLVGSEGTLGLFTSATLHTSPLPSHRGIVLLLFGSLEEATRCVQAITPLQPSACDLMDRRVLSLGREADPRFAAMIPAGSEAALIVEQTGNSRREIQNRIARVVSAARATAQSTHVAHEAFDFDDVEFLWSLPQRVVPLLTRLKGTTRPLPFVEDIAVPPENLHDFLLATQRVFQDHEVTASLYAHAAAGQLHLRPFLPQPSDETGPKIEELAHDLYEVVFQQGGTISGEHGDGLARTAFVPSQYGPLYRVFQFIKDLFDPQRRLNPGKILGDDPHLTRRNFRPLPTITTATPPELVSLKFSWAPEELVEVAGDCNGCGVCRTQSRVQRMCPFFRINPSEHASPRAKANAIRALHGPLAATALETEQLHQLASLCFNCKQCQLECPGHVNVPHLMIEAKAARVDADGLGRFDWTASRVHSLSAFGSIMPRAANWLLTQPSARWFLEKLLGIHRERKLPLLARRSFLRSLKRRWTIRPRPGSNPRPVVYFVDHFANHHDPELAMSLVRVLEHNKIPVHVPRDQQPSGMNLVSAGDLSEARELAAWNLRELGELAREGHRIICTEPSAAVCLKQEYPELLDHPDAAAVAEQVVEAGTFLAERHEAGELSLDFQPLELTVGYHTPCHLKTLDDSSSFQDLLSLIPGLQVSTIEEGCSGMAGAYGIMQENYATSMEIGRPLMSRMQRGDLNIGTTECSSCRIQMQQGTTIQTLHPLKLLALSYGLAPEIRQRLSAPGQKLVIA
ncbi:MAG: oxidase [Planctomycetaceae bacterium]|nr:oxidase [Planctomycetaceae bacterium]